MGRGKLMKSIKTKILAMIGGIAILAMIISGVFTMKNTVKTVSKNQESISTLTTKNIKQWQYKWQGIHL